MFEKIRKMFKKEDNENLIENNATYTYKEVEKQGDNRDDIFIKKIIQLIRFDKIDAKLENESDINYGKASILIDESRGLFLRIKYCRTYSELYTQHFESIVNCIQHDTCFIEISDRNNVLYKKYDTKYNRNFAIAIREKFFNVKDIEDKIINMK